MFGEEAQSVTVVNATIFDRLISLALTTRQNYQA